MAPAALGSLVGLAACSDSGSDPDPSPPGSVLPSGSPVDPPNTDGGPLPDGALPPSDSGADDAHVPPGSCGTPGAATGFLASLSVRVGSATRTYALSVPAGYDGTRLYPLIVGFHGDGGTGAGYRTSFAIESQPGAAEGAIFAWPNGTNKNNGHSFDQDHSPPTANADVDFFDAMTAAIKAAYCVDASRVYAHGMSGGAYFTNQLGRWRGNVLRGVAPQSGGGPFGNGSGDFDPQTGSLKLGVPVAAFIVHGSSDGSVTLSEGQKSLAYWRLANKSTSGQAATTPSPCQRQNGGTKPVVFCTISGMGHTLWTGAPAAIWKFFQDN